MYFANEVRDFEQIPKGEGEKVPKREEITVAPPTTERGRGKVVDIFAALKQSLEQAASKREAAREPVRKTGRKRRKA